MAPPEHEPRRELTLDPANQAEWEVMKALGRRMVDDMIDYLAQVRERPVYQPIPANVLGQLRTPPPRSGQPAATTYAEFQEQILPFPHGNIHPRFWGWVAGNGSATGMFAELLAGAMNNNSGFGNQSQNHLETQVLDWFRELFGLPEESSGILVSGCTVANLTGLAVARNTKAEVDLRSVGLQAAPRRMRVYGSVETHSSSVRALEVLGLGSDALHRIAVDAEGRVNVSAMEVALREDRDRGELPFCVIGNAGTANTGALDDLVALSDLCRREQLWFHVDGAFGALLTLSPALADRVAGLERADSIAFDLHKWLHVPYDCGAVLIRDRAAQAGTFPMGGAYLKNFESGVATGPFNFMQNGLQMSRGFRALKVWMTIKEHGFDKLGELILQNVRQAERLGQAIAACGELELVAPVTLNVVCFRYVGTPSDTTDLDTLNRDLLMQLHNEGVAVPSFTSVNGQAALRVAITNHRSREADFELLLREVRRRGALLGDNVRTGERARTP